MFTARRPRITVIGAGIVGICCASWLLREGFDVEIVDPLPPGSPDQCSYGNAGGVCPGSCVPIGMPGMLKDVPGWLLDPEGPLFVRLAYLPAAMPWIVRLIRSGRRDRVRQIADAMRALHGATFECYEPLLLAAGCTDLFERRGQLFVYGDAKNLDPNGFGLALRRERGVKVEILDAASLRELEPSLSPRFSAGVLLPEQGQCRNPGRLVEALAQQAARDGARFRLAHVRGFEWRDGLPSALRTTDGAIQVERIVIAAGAWSGELVRQLGSIVPLESERGYHAMVLGADPGLRVQTIWSERKFVATPMEEGLRLAGTVELAGLEAPPDMRRADVLLKLGSQMFDRLEVGEVRRWMGHRPGMPDTIPVIGRSPIHRNVYFAFGHGHMGLIGGSVTGRVIAELAAGKAPFIDLSPYRPDRFGAVW
jgi:D-amino-acid dehydrogenase